MYFFKKYNKKKQMLFVIYNLMFSDAYLHFQILKNKSQENREGEESTFRRFFFLQLIKRAALLFPNAFSNNNGC